MSFERFIKRLSSDSGVICNMPRGSRSSFALCDCATSPCQWNTGIPDRSSSSSSRRNWSLIRLFNGAIYKTPTVSGIFSQSNVIIGKNAASVLPDAVDDDRSRFLSVSNIALAAASCTARRSCQPLLYMNSCINGENR